MAGAPCGACGQGCGSGQCPASQQGAAPQGQAQGCVPPPTEPARPRRPELLNRLDEVLVFRSLGRADVRAIAELELRQVAARLAARGVALEVSGPVMALICARGYDQARPRAAPRPQAGPTPARRATRAAPRSPACRHGASGLPGACAPHALRVRRSKRCCPGLRSEGDGVLPAACRGVGWPAGHDKWMADRSSSARATRAAPQAYGARPLRRALVTEELKQFFRCAAAVQGQRAGRHGSAWRVGGRERAPRMCACACEAVSSGCGRRSSASAAHVT